MNEERREELSFRWGKKRGRRLRRNELKVVPSPGFIGGSSPSGRWRRIYARVRAHTVGGGGEKNGGGTGDEEKE